MDGGSGQTHLLLHVVCGSDMKYIKRNMCTLLLLHQTNLSLNIHIKSVTPDFYLFYPSAIIFFSQVLHFPSSKTYAVFCLSRWIM